MAHSTHNTNVSETQQVLTNYTNLKFRVSVRGKFHMSTKVTECTRVKRLVTHMNESCPTQLRYCQTWCANTPIALTFHIPST